MRNFWRAVTSVPVEPRASDLARVSGVQAVEDCAEAPPDVAPVEETSRAAISASRTFSSAYRDWMREAVELAVVVVGVFGVVVVAACGTMEFSGMRLLLRGM